MYQLERAPLYARTLHNSRLLFQYGQSQGLHMLGSRNFSAISGSAVHPVTFKRSGYDLIQTNRKQESWHLGSRGLHSWNFYASKYLSPDFPPIGYAQKFLETVHETTGLPWWAAIILTSFTVRTVVTLPLSVYSVHILARVQNLAPEIEGIAQELKLEVMDATKRMKWDEKMAKYQYRINLYRLIKELYIRDNCHPFKASLVAWIQFPMWISISLALRNMSGSLHIPGAVTSVLCPELASEGILWFSNLLLPETTFIIPVAACVMNLLIIEMYTWKPQKPGKIEMLFTNVMRGVSLMIIPIGGIVPSCMCLYWASSSFYGLVQNLALKHPKVRQTLRMPSTRNDSTTPYRDMLQFGKQKYARIFKRLKNIGQRNDSVKGS